MKENQNIPKLRFPEFEGEWKRDKLNKVLKAIDGDRGKNYPTSEDFLDDGFCLFLNAKNITKAGFSLRSLMFISEERDNLLNKGRLIRNDIILTTRGSIGHIAHYTETIPFNDVRINSGMVILRSIHERNSPPFLYILLNSDSVKKQMNIISFGSAQPQLTIRDINKIKLKLPTLPEQQKIASFLSEVDAKIQQLKKKKELLEQYKKGMTQKLFPSTSSGELPELRFKDSNGNEFPKWEKKKLGEIVSFRNGKGHEQEIDTDGKFVVVNSKFISTNGLVKKYCKSQISPLKKGEVVMVMSDVPNGKALAKCYYIEKNDAYTLNQRICAFSKKTANTLFIYYRINRMKYFLSFDSGVGQTNLKKDEILNCPVSLPQSIEEQTKIASFLQTLDEKISQVDTQLTKAETWKKGLLQHMFV